MITTLTMNPALDIATSTARVQPTAKLRCRQTTVHPGGGGVNVARTVHRLGGQVRAVLPIGGSTGQRVHQLLRDEGLACDVVDVAGDTRESLCVDDQADGSQYRFVLPGPWLTGAEQDACLEKLLDASEEGGWVVLSGSLPGGVSADLLRRLGDGCRTLGARLVVDVPGDVLHDAADVGAYLIKPDLSELEVLVGRPLVEELDEEQAAADAIDSGLAEVVVLSLGERGALLATADGVQRIRARQVDLNSAVGAGDSLVGGLVFALWSGWSMPKAAEFGVAAGSAALASPGTQLGDPAAVWQLYENAHDAEPQGDRRAAVPNHK